MIKIETTLEKRGTSFGFHAQLNKYFHLEFMPYQSSLDRICVEIEHVGKGKAIFAEHFYMSTPEETTDDLKQFIVDVVSAFCHLEIEFTNFPDKLYTPCKSRDSYIQTLYHIECSQTDAITLHGPYLDNIRIDYYLTDGGIHLSLKPDDVVLLTKLLNIKGIVLKKGSLQRCKNSSL